MAVLQSSAKKQTLSTMSFCLLLVIITFIGTSRQDSITPTSPAVHAKEKEAARISCEYKYTVSMNNLQWYRQYPNAKPEFLVLIMESGQNQTATPPHPRLTTSVNKDKKLVNLEIFPADVKDSAVYYCALQNTGSLGKIIFGQGTKLFIHSKTEVKPNIYKVGNSCLATDFTKHNEFNISGSPFHKTSAVRYSGQSYYSSFKFSSYDCEETGICSSSSGGTDLERDEKVNFLSLGIFWLRILFLKTVVFNVLVTFKAWMS